MALTLGYFSKRIMHVPYRLPESFGLMVIVAALVFGEPAITTWLGTGWFISKGIIFLAGVCVSLFYLWVLTNRNDE